MMWQGPYDLRGEESVIYYAMGTVENRLMVVGIVGDEENVKGLKVWEIKEKLELGLGMVELGV
ncbi:F-box/kelch-repeat protein, partial [Trifolium medium]|nr:F-box/kelch-repeat protein [Trifolium medium]